MHCAPMIQLCFSYSLHANLRAPRQRELPGTATVTVVPLQTGDDEPHACEDGNLVQKLELSCHKHKEVMQVERTLARQSQAPEVGLEPQLQAESGCGSDL